LTFSIRPNLAIISWRLFSHKGFGVSFEEKSILASKLIGKGRRKK
jgi:hypothetical protein